MKNDASGDAADGGAGSGDAAAPVLRWETISNEDYVTYAFRIILGREPDPGSFQDYVKALNGGTTKLQVEIGIYRSVEARNRRADNIYEPAPSLSSISNENFAPTLFVILLRRNIDPTSKRDYAARLDAGSTRADIIAEFMASPEFKGSVF